MQSYAMHLFFHAIKIGIEKKDGVFTPSKVTLVHNNCYFLDELRSAALCARRANP